MLKLGEIFCIPAEQNLLRWQRFTFYKSYFILNGTLVNKLINMSNSMRESYEKVLLLEMVVSVLSQHIAKEFRSLARMI